MKLHEVLDDMSQQLYTEAARHVVQHCMPYLKATNYGEQQLWRGMNRSGAYQHKTPRQTRNPLDTHPAVHDAANAFFEAKFGIPLRSQSVFVSTDKIAAMRFGDEHLVFPTGSSWRLYGSAHIRDFTAHTSKQLYDQYLPELFSYKLSKAVWNAGRPPELSDEELEQVHEAVYSILEKAQYQQIQPKDLEQFPEKNEIMMVADGYYAILATEHSDVNQEIYQIIRDQIDRN